MTLSFRSVAILGAGKMGRQIAAAFASIGCDVLLMDMPGPQSPNQFVEAGYDLIMSESPPPFFLERDLRRIRRGNFQDDFQKLRDVDLVLEVIKEDLSAKIKLFTDILPFIGPHTKVATNTSGIPISLIASHLPAEMVPRFIGGIHFFNPTRLSLLELIFADHVSEEERSAIARFFRDRMGKQVIQVHDRPAFAANRVGIFATMYVLQTLARGEFTIPELEVLTGPLVGRPSSATFRTCDKVGLVTLQHVTDFLYQALPEDPQREIFKAPEFLRALVKRGDIGVDAGKGFSMKDRSKGAILSLNPTTMAYEPLTADGLGDLRAVQKLPTPAARVAALIERDDRIGKFVREYLLALLHYCAWRIPEVAEDPGAIDTALRSGFLWEIGPFELWNALGPQKIAGMMAKQGLDLPEWIETVIAEDGVIPTVAPAHGHCGPILKIEPDSQLCDLGDGVLQFRLTSKMNTLSMGVIDSLNRALDEVAFGSYRGLVIGDGVSQNFCAGANLAEIGGSILTGDFASIDRVVARLQAVFDRLYSFEKPVAGALSGMALGGGAELLIALARLAAHYDSYVGLVELGAGVIPAGCGSTHFAYWAAEQARARTEQDAPRVLPFLREAFLRIATGAVTSSAQEAIDAGFLTPATRIVMRRDEVLNAAKAEVIRSSEAGFTPRPPREPFLVLGAEGRAVLEVGIEGFVNSGRIPPYDAHLARTLAYVMTGGNLSGPSFVTVQYLYDLERENFIELLRQPGTHEKLRRFMKAR